MVTIARFRVPLLLLLLGLFFPFEMSAEDDFQSWNNLKIGAQLSDSFSSTAAFEARLYDDARNLRHKRVGQVLQYRANDMVSLGLGFRHTLKESIGGSRSTEDRWEFALQHGLFTMGNWRWDMRHRLEQVRPGGDKTLERSRHRLRLRKSIDGQFNLKHFFATAEGFLSFDAEKVVETRVIPFGLGFVLTDASGITAAYMLRSVRKPNDWQHAHVLELSLSLDI
jgi:hypothetical protein